MANNTVTEFARELKVSADTLLSQLKSAGVQVSTVNDEISDADKRQLLDSLRQERVASPRKITVTRRETSTIRQNDGQGGARTIEVEVRRRRVFVKNRAAEAMRAEIEAQAKAQLDRQLKEKQEAEAAEAAKREAQAKLEAEEAAKKAAEEAAAKKAAEEKAAAEKAAAEKAAAEAAARQAEAEKLAAEKAAAEKLAAEKARQAQIEAEKKAQREAEAAKKAAAAKAAAEKAAAEKAELEARRQEARRKAQEEADAIRAMLAKPKTVLKAKADRGDKSDRNEEAKKTQQQNAQQKPAQKSQKADKPVANKPEKSEGKSAGKGRNKQSGKGNDRWGDEDRGGRRGGMKTRGAVDSDESSSWHSRGRKNHKHEQRQVQMPTEPVVREVTVPETISVADLAHKMSVKATEVIKTLMKMGQMVTINQMLDQETAMIIVEEMGHKALAAKADDPESLLGELESNLEQYPEVPRPPVVTIMGHVDHGKTSILDRIRNAHVTDTEAGGITQHIGAYQVEYEGKKITFLDTPGHEAFTAMRARGANVTDIAILVVAADDGIMPQTIESINHAKAAGVSIIVAINKMDKEGADPDRVKQQLTEQSLVVEEWGGDVIAVPVSAKTGMGIDELLENILLVAEVKELKANPDRLARGTVVEARLDKGKGPVATLLVQNGTLKSGDVIIAGTSVGRIRTMTNDKGRSIKEAGPSTPVEITGLGEVPSAGDVFNAVADEKLARELVEQRKHEAKEELFQQHQKVTLDNLFSQIAEGEMKELPIIVKADVQGSVEAVKQSLEKLSNDEVRVKVIHGGVGAVSESDVMLANASNAIIVGFNVRPDPVAKQNAEQSGVDIRLYRIIYDAIEEITDAMKGMLAPKYREVETARIEVRQVYKISNVGTVAGSYVLDGKVGRNNEIRVVRDGIVIAEDKMSSLKRFKDDAKEVAAGFECGITLEKFTDIKEGDIFEAFYMEEYRD